MFYTFYQRWLPFTRETLAFCCDPIQQLDIKRSNQTRACEEEPTMCKRCTMYVLMRGSTNRVDLDKSVMEFVGVIFLILSNFNIERKIRREIWSNRTYRQNPLKNSSPSTLVAHVVLSSLALDFIQYFALNHSCLASIFRFVYLCFQQCAFLCMRRSSKSR